MRYTYRIPSNDINISRKCGAIQVLRDIDIHKVTEMMKHVHNCNRYQNIG